MGYEKLGPGNYKIPVTASMQRIIRFRLNFQELKNDQEVQYRVSNKAGLGALHSAKPLSLCGLKWTVKYRGFKLMFIVAFHKSAGLQKTRRLLVSINQSALGGFSINQF
jgi:hypothetical protein